MSAQRMAGARAPGGSARVRTAVAVAAAAGVVAVGVPALAAPAARPASGCTIAAVGDIAGKDDLANAKATGQLIASAGVRKLVVLGDLDYDDTANLSNYDQAYGSLKPVTFPVRGNHEDAAGYATYFGNPKPQAAIEVCGWRVLSIDQYAPGGVAAGARFIAAERAAHPSQPMAVAWHEPRWSSGGEHGDSTAVQPLWAAAVTAGVQVVLNAHDHDFERMAPMDAAGKADPSGPVQFVSGRGGHHMRPLGSGTAGVSAQTIDSGQPGVLFLALAADGGYTATYRDTGGTTGDSVAVAGTGSGAAAAPTTAAPSSAGPSRRRAPAGGATATPEITLSPVETPSSGRRHPGGTAIGRATSKFPAPSRPRSTGTARPTAPAAPTAGRPTTSRGALSWAPPAGWQSYPVKKVTGTSGQNVVDCGGGDARIQLPATPVSPVKITGCRNVVMLGGTIRVLPVSRLGGEDQRAIYVEGCTGTVHIEGVLIDGDVNGSEADGITASAPSAVLQVENVRVQGLRGSVDGNHADVIQAWGGVAALRVDRLTGESNYQGIQTKADTATSGPMIFRNVNVRGHTKATTAKGGWLFWAGEGNAKDAQPVTLDRFYIEPRAGRTLSASVWDSAPAVTAAGGKGAAVELKPTENVKGVIVGGPPPGGDFVPAGVAGPGYRSPGYLPTGVAR
jgi:hypothetical protein